MQIKINKDGQLYCDSSIDLGILGVYNNIEISVWNEHYFEEMTEEEKIVYVKKINHKNNVLYQKIINNKDEIENDFLTFLFGEFCDSDFEFWEWIGDSDTTCIIEEKMPKVVNIETIYGAINYDKEFAVLSGMERFERYLPMIDVQKIIDSIIPLILEINDFDDDFMYSFEFNSMELGHDLLLATVCQFNQDGKLFVRDNRG